MGVRGLWKMLRNAAQDGSLEMLRNKCVAVDTSIWISTVAHSEKKTMEKIAHIATVLGRYAIRPVFVIDRKASDAKLAATAKRRERHAEERQKRRTDEMDEAVLRYIETYSGAGGSAEICEKKKEEVEKEHARREPENEHTHIEEKDVAEAMRYIETKEFKSLSIEDRLAFLVELRNHRKYIKDEKVRETGGLGVFSVDQIRHARRRNKVVYYIDRLMEEYTAAGNFKPVANDEYRRYSLVFLKEKGTWTFMAGNEEYEPYRVENMYKSEEKIEELYRKVEARDIAAPIESLQDPVESLQEDCVEICVENPEQKTQKKEVCAEQKTQKKEQVLEKMPDFYAHLDYEKEVKKALGPTRGCLYTLVELLNAAAIPYALAAFDAEAECADMERRGIVDAVLTEDSDALLFGAATIYRHCFSKRDVRIFTAEKIRETTGLDRNALINSAALLGCDYFAGVAGVGPEKALEILARYKTLLEIKEHLLQQGKEVPASETHLEVFRRPLLAGAAPFFGLKADIPAVRRLLKSCGVKKEIVHEFVKTIKKQEDGRGWRKGS